MKKIPSDHKTQKHYFNMNGVIKLSKCLYLYLARWDREPNLRFSSSHRRHMLHRCKKNKAGIQLDEEMTRVAIPFH